MSVKVLVVVKAAVAAVVVSKVVVKGLSPT